MGRSAGTQGMTLSSSTEFAHEWRRHLSFSLILLLSIAIFILAPLCLIKTDFYIRHSNYFYDPVIDYKSSLSGRSDDIVFYGDSSALHNVMPRIIEQSVPLKVYNLGFPGSVVAGAPNLMLDRYLQHNKRPGTIILYLAPTSGVNGHVLDNGHFYEAGMALERYASLMDAIRFYAAQPRRAFGVSAVVVRNLLTPPEPTEKNYRSVTGTLAEQSGWAPTPEIFNGGVGMLAAEPREKQTALTADSKYILDFKAKYEALGIKVLVYVSPVRACADLSTSEVAAAYATLADNAPYSFPCADFLGGFHLVAKAAEANSLIVSEFLQRELNIKKSAEN